MVHPKLFDVEDAYEDCCNRLDDLTMQQIDLLEEQLTLTAKLENTMKAGFIELAESRKNMEKKFTSIMLLPSEEMCAEPVTFIDHDSANYLCLKRNEHGKNPITFFGVLVPRSLRKSQAAFQEALEIIVDLVNTRNEWCNSLVTTQEVNRMRKVAYMKESSSNIKPGVHPQ